MATVTGTGGNDTIGPGAPVTTTDDVIFGGTGNDSIDASGGNDSIFGGAGNDSISGNTGNDTAAAGTGNDTVSGDGGDDVVRGGGGNDSLSGGEGNDEVFGETAADADAGETLNNFVFNGANTSGPVPNATAGSSIVYNAVGTTAEGTVINVRITLVETNGPITVNMNNGTTVNDVLFLNPASDPAQQGSTATFRFDFFTGSGATETPVTLNGDFSILDLDLNAGAEQVKVSATDFDSYTLENGSSVGVVQDGDDYTFSGTQNNTGTAATNPANGVNLGFSGQDSLTITLTSRGTNSGFGFNTQTFTGTEVPTTTPGNDIIDLGAGADIGYGGAGDDTLTGGTGDDSVFGGDGADRIVLTNGFGTDAMFGGSDPGTTTDDDVIDASGLTTNGVNLVFTADEDGTISDQTNPAGTFDNVERIILSNQADTVDASATTTARSIDGAAGNDSILGGSGADTIVGGTGSDTLNGGAGADTITAGDDADTVNLTNGFGADTITGGEGAGTSTDSDTLNLSGVTTAATVILTGSEAGTAAAGGSTATFSQFENFVLTGQGDSFNGAAATTAVSVDGGAGADSITGGAAADIILGGTGADTLAGGAGADTIDGGADQDTIKLDDGFGADSITGGSAGVDDDTLDASDVGTGVTVNLTGTEAGTIAGGGSTATFGDIENFVLSGGNDTFNGGAATGPLDVNGGAGADSITGGSGGDTLTGGAGADTLAGGAGADTIDGGADQDTIKLDDGFGADSITGGSTGVDDDTLDASDVGTGVTVNLTGTEAGTIAGGGSTATFGDIENFVLSGGNDTFNGGAATGPLDVNGGAGNDSITGGAAADIILGGTGADTLAGGAGADTIDGGADQDTIKLDDGFGADSITGGSTGVDDDTLDASDVGTGVTVNLTGTEAGTIAGGGSTATFGDIENFVLSGGNDTFNGGAATGPLDVNGGAGADSITGGSGGDTLAGGAGADTLAGGAGADTIDGGADQDTIKLDDGFGADSITGGSTGVDDDTLDASDVGTGVTVDLTGPEAGTISGGGSTATFGDIENLVLTDQGDTVNGGGVNGPLDIDAGGGDDAITTGSGPDTVDGGEGSDSITTGGGNDSIDGGTGVDLIEGGEGNDTISGGDDADVIRLEDGFGADVIDGGSGPGTTADDDLLDMTGIGTGVNVVLTGDEDGTVTDGTSTATFTDFENFDLTDQDDTLDGSASNTPITAAGGGGQDTLIGGRGDDVFFGGDDNDRFVAGPDDDVTGGEGPVPGGPDDQDTLQVTGPFEVEFTPGDPESGTVFLLDPNGVRTGETVTFREIERIVCFTRGAMIRTPSGEVAIETLKVGDLVDTLDHGPQPLRWIGSRKVAAVGAIAPVTIKAGALGNTRDLSVSPQHRMLIADWRAELMFGQPEVLARAKDLVNGDTIYRAETGAEVEYFHILFDSHEIVFAEGAPSESFHPGEMGLSALEEEIREEVLSLFPELRVNPAMGYGRAARMSLKAHETRALRG